MNRFLILVFFLFSFNLNAQDSIITNFINDVAKEVVPQDFEYYNLLNSSFILDLDEYTFFQDRRQLKKLYPDFPFENFEKVKDSSIYNWKALNLEKAICYNAYDELPRHTSYSYKITRIANSNLNQSQIDSLNLKTNSNEIYVRIKSHWSEKRKRKEYEKAWKRSDSFIKKENEKYYIFSTPIFSNDNTYALISVKIGIKSKKIIFVKTDNSWKKIYEFNLEIA